MDTQKSSGRINWTRSEVILACSLLADNNWKWMHPSDPRAVELSELLRKSPEHPSTVRQPTFRNPNGVVRKMQDLQSRMPDYKGTPTHGSKLDRDVLHEFRAEPVGMQALAERIRTAIRRSEAAPYIVSEVTADPEMAAYEGAVAVAAHLTRERDRSLREAKLQSVRSAGRPIACEICGFDFARTYGDQGAGYIEVHHSLPLHESGPVRTRLADLVLLCANCHRMIHRGKRWLTPDELRAVVATRSAK
jgi:5-methylcytosine-specific restriction protein A